MASEKKIVVFTVGDSRYGVDISSVKEIMPAQKTTQVPNAPHSVKGVTSLRGRVMPVLCLSTCLNITRDQHEEPTRIIVIEHGREIVGCLVDSVREVLSIDSEQIEPLPESLCDQHSRLLGMIRTGDDLVTLIDMERVIDTIAV